MKGKIYIEHSENHEHSRIYSSCLFLQYSILECLTWNWLSKSIFVFWQIRHKLGIRIQHDTRSEYSFCLSHQYSVWWLALVIRLSKNHLGDTSLGMSEKTFSVRINWREDPYSERSVFLMRSKESNVYLTVFTFILWLCLLLLLKQTLLFCCPFLFASLSPLLWPFNMNWMSARNSRTSAQDWDC